MHAPHACHDGPLHHLASTGRSVSDELAVLALLVDAGEDGAGPLATLNLAEPIADAVSAVVDEAAAAGGQAAAAPAARQPPTGRDEVSERDCLRHRVQALDDDARVDDVSGADWSGRGGRLGEPSAGQLVRDVVVCGDLDACDRGCYGGAAAHEGALGAGMAGHRAGRGRPEDFTGYELQLQHGEHGDDQEGVAEAAQDGVAGGCCEGCHVGIEKRVAGCLHVARASKLEKQDEWKKTTPSSMKYVNGLIGHRRSRNFKYWIELTVAGQSQA